MFLANYLTSTANAYADRWQSNSLRAKRVDNPRFDQIAKAKQYAVVLI